MRSTLPFVLFFGLALAPLLGSCHTSKAEKIAFHEDNYEAQFDGAESLLDQVDALLAEIVGDDEPTGEAAAIATDLDDAFQLLAELRGELDRAVEKGETETLSALSGPAIVLVRSAGLLMRRAQELRHTTAGA